MLNYIKHLLDPSEGSAANPRATAHGESGKLKQTAHAAELHPSPYSYLTIYTSATLKVLRARSGVKADPDEVPTAR